jgi:hypothetical protein
MAASQGVRGFLCNPGYLCLQLADWGRPQTNLPAGTELISSCVKMRSCRINTLERNRTGTSSHTTLLQLCYIKLNSLKREMLQKTLKPVLTGYR